MANEGLQVRVREERERRGWSQAELAERAGVSRAAVSAIETGRVVPSTVAALALAAAFGCRVEDVFIAGGWSGAAGAAWAWQPRGESLRFWVAEVGGRWFRYPVEATAVGLIPHDGAIGRTTPSPPSSRPAAGGADPRRTLVVAGCDPAVALLGGWLAREAEVRLLPFIRSSGRALELLRDGRVHAAGLHLGEGEEGNARWVRDALGAGYRLVRVAGWVEGVALAPGLGLGAIPAVVRAGLRWVGREEGSGARRCLDQILEGRSPRPAGYGLAASDHRGVVEAIRTGWAQAGVCIRLAAEEGGLDFLPVRTEAYDLCYRAELEDDPRLVALLDAVRAQRFRRLLAELPGYDARRTGELSWVG